MKVLKYVSIWIGSGLLVVIVFCIHFLPTGGARTERLNQMRADELANHPKYSNTQNRDDGVPGISPPIEQWTDERGMREMIAATPFSEWSGKIEQFVASDPELCAVLVNSLEDATERARAIQLVAYYWARLDYETAKTWMNTHLSKAEALYYREFLVDGLISADAERAKNEVLDIESPVIKQRLALELVDAIANSDPSGAEDWVLRSLSPVQAAEALEYLGRNLLRGGKLDEAMGVVSRMSYGHSRNSLLAQIGEEFGRLDHRSAMKWLETLESADRLVVEPRAMMGWALADPRGAADFVVNSATSNPTSLDSVVSTWAAASPMEAADWVGSNIGNGQNSKDLMGLVMQRWGATDPDEAADYLTKMDSGGDRGYFMSLVVSSWVARDPAKAGAFLSGIKGDDAISATGLLVQVWSSLDSMAASKWAASLEQGPAYDVACAGLAESMGATDPGSAALWAGAIGESEKRRQVLSALFRELAQKDTTTAMNLVPTLGLSSDDRKAVEEVIERHGK